MTAENGGPEYVVHKYFCLVRPAVSCATIPAQCSNEEISEGVCQVAMVGRSAIGNSVSDRALSGPIIGLNSARHRVKGGGSWFYLLDRRLLDSEASTQTGSAGICQSSELEQGH